MAYLFILKGPNQGKLHPLDRAKTVLGRDESCDIVLKLPDPGKQKAISQKHAIVTREPDGKFYIEDGDGQGKPSKNHTLVNEVRVQMPFPGRMHLKHNDVIEICDFTFIFHDSASDPPFDASISHDSGSLFAQTVEKLRLLLEIGNRLSHTLELDALLPQVVDSLLKHFKQADRAFLIEVDEASGEFVTRILRTRRAAKEPETSFSESIVGECLRTLKGLLSNDPGNQFPESESVTELSLRSVMCVPLWSQEGKAFGVLLLDSKNFKKKFTGEDLNFLMGVANQASIALANARFHRDALARERLSRDLALAREVVRSFLPARVPELPGYEFFACSESALEVGGDYYDFVPLKERRLGILVGDVAGKGVAAALVMARFSAEARVCVRTESDLASAVRQLNELMQPLNLTDRFLTLAALLLDPEAHTVTVVDAGHPPPLLLRRTTGELEAVAPRAIIGPPLGVLEGFPFESHQFRLEPGDNLIIFSDGVTEAMDSQGQELGMPRLRAVLQRGGVSPRKLGERILKAVKEHAAGCSQHDDITLVCFGRMA